MYRTFIVSLLAAGLLGCQSASDISSSKSSASARQSASQDITIAYEKYTLENGLTVILHEDTSDPLVHVDVTYHVGSAREEIGKSGFAHFFEHMMFQGSKHVADEQHFAIINEAGGDMNGTTNVDRTNYYQTVPSNQLEKVLWLEADRMGFLLDAVTQEKFEVQRDTVKNERAQRVDNQPYGLLNERTIEALYPIGHPYSWSTIGYVEDLNRVGVNDLKAFFTRWYGPNNAVITVGGDINVAQTKAWIEKYFGGIPRGPEVMPDKKQPATLTEDRYVTLEDQVYLPLVKITFPTVYARHEDEAPLDVLSDILGGGKTSILYKNLVKTGDAVQAFVSHPCLELACTFNVLALANTAQTPDLKTLSEKMLASLSEFETRGVQDDDLQRVKASIEASSIYSLQSVQGKVSMLAANETFFGEPDLLQSDLDRYQSVTAEDVMRVYNQYIKGKAKIVVSIVPAGQVEIAAAPATFVFERENIENIATVGENITAPVIEDDFNRAMIPPAGPSPQISLPEFWQHKTKNGIDILGAYSGESPTTTLILSMEGGPLLDPIEKAGLAAFTAEMMNQATLNYSTEEMDNQLSLNWQQYIRQLRWSLYANSR